MRARSAAAALALLWLPACGGAPPAPPVVAPLPPPILKVAEPPPPPPAVDLSELPPPKDLAFTARLGHIAALLRLAQTLPGLPGLAALPDVEMLTTLAVGAPVGAVIDVDAPIDVALAHPAGGADQFAVSAQLVDDPRVIEAFEKHFQLVPTDNGASLLRRRGKDAPAAPDDDDDEMPGGARSCLIAPAADHHGARLVCGDDAKALRALAPYLTRTVARAPLTADLRLDVRLGPLADRMNLDDDVDVSSAEGRMKNELATKLARDVATMTLEGSFDGSALDAALTMGFGSSASPLAQALLSQASPPGQPPAAFFRLPADALLAFHTQGAAPADLTRLRAVLSDAMRESLMGGGVSAAEADAGLKAFGDVLITGGPLVFASGVDVEAATKALGAYVQADKHTEAARKKARAAVQGWFLAGVEEPSARWADAVRALVTIDEHPTPRDRTKTKDVAADKERTLTRVKPLPAGIKLPAGTLHVEQSTTPSATALKASAAERKKQGAAAGVDDDGPIAHTTHLFIVPDGGRTWIAIAEDPKLAAAKVQAALAGAPEAGTLGARRDVDAFRTSPTSAGLLASLAGVTIQAHDAVSYADLTGVNELLGALAALPGNGKTPTPVLVAARREGPGGSIAVRAKLPIPALIDAVRVIDRFF